MEVDEINHDEWEHISYDEVPQEEDKEVPPPVATMLVNLQGWMQKLVR